MGSATAQSVSELREQLSSLHVSAWAWARVCCAGDRNEARDVLQSAYLAILEGGLVFEGRSSFKAWLFGVVKRTALGRRNRLRRRFTLLERWFRERGEGRAPDPERLAEHAEQGARVRAALTRLSTRQRQVIELAFYHDLSLGDAAEVLGISLGSVKVHYDRGKKELRRLLEDELER